METSRFIFINHYATSEAFWQYLVGKYSNPGLNEKIHQIRYIYQMVYKLPGY
jgi:hypothetical protein